MGIPGFPSGGPPGAGFAPGRGPALSAEARAQGGSVRIQAFGFRGALPPASGLGKREGRARSGGRA